MTCQTCDEPDPECVDDCEKYPRDIHTTPPNRWINEIPRDPRRPPTPEERLTRIEQNIRDIQNELQKIRESGWRAGY